ncbi:MAG: hypothetical protein NTZ18_03200 [Candidatus Komeilibacteria bacterium]|nr:hypothetical protein [Candidatus Komeilibacteria bacterium]
MDSTPISFYVMVFLIAIAVFLAVLVGIKDYKENKNNKINKS